MWSHLHWSMEPGVPRGLDDPVICRAMFFSPHQVFTMLRVGNKTPTIWCYLRKCPVSSTKPIQVTHSQKALLFSFDLSPYKIYKATNPPFLKQTVFLMTFHWAPLAYTPHGVHMSRNHSWEHLLQSFQCCYKNPHQTTKIGDLQKRSSRSPPPKIPWNFFRKTRL